MNRSWLKHEIYNETLSRSSAQTGVNCSPNSRAAAPTWSWRRVCFLCIADVNPDRTVSREVAATSLTQVTISESCNIITISVILFVTRKSNIIPVMNYFIMRHTQHWWHGNQSSAGRTRLLQPNQPRPLVTSAEAQRWESFALLCTRKMVLMVAQSSAVEFWQEAMCVLQGKWPKEYVSHDAFLFLHNFEAEWTSLRK